MNKGLIVPIAALLAGLFKQLFNIEISQGDIETTINVLLLLVSGVGIFMNPRKKVNKDVTDHQ